MDKDDLIASDDPLSSDQRLTLAGLLDTIIPPSNDGRLPSAAELDLVGHLREHAPEHVETLTRAIAALEALSGRSPQDFRALTRSERTPIVSELQAQEPVLFDAVHVQTLSCYYTSDAVRVGLGLEPGPPFPRGNTIEQGDLSLLDPVMKREKLYKP